MTSPEIFVAPVDNIPNIWSFRPSIDVFNISEAVFDAACPIDSRVLGEVGAVLMQELFKIPGVVHIEIKSHSVFLIQKAPDADWVELQPRIVDKLKVVFGEQSEKVVVKEEV